jgi:hypothetical protein
MASYFSGKTWVTKNRELKCDSTSESELSTTAFEKSTVECRRAGIAQYHRYSYGLDDWGSVPARAKISFLHNVQTGSKAHAVSYPVRIASRFPGDKTARALSCPLIFI